MRLLTHNLLQCHKKGVRNGYPLIIKPDKMAYQESPFNKELVVGMMTRVEYPVLLQALAWVREYQPFASGAELPGGLPSLPEALPMDFDSDEDLLRRLHVVLFDIFLVEGKLVCPESGREFPVTDKIPNMLLNEDEV
mmetsp:Transcript_5775/g.8170  ORF Transcript_5775/g.8170 Transcript_5775/m.8170 type:complete len:137 (-) Transcript_5775:122-532(-)|eukprot:CAMPEP_0194756614 /NCGR_PEP_ID=MMETSP0323_2-20130528/10283_1 /TAXON_ID=2866 ORGANISM="Crypthecodinium cohnii, Strain Seligo" /NCGR_SAMPLE_ID=MMETSP0323_2 /ASSEMBLY_ACC=CAM_ASM_000346 /LENGTH=136 /DNA_ID=CAMNT_0039676203 /DNA_START=48 /DNA_END=458 /DNA_ORIENTATION=+